uniref:Uncharacterized protein n=1 Tax=Avena sativa TaxID=4498 RepID=A0ACD5UH98_AVESA
MWSRDARARLLAIAVACCMAAAPCSAQGTTADAAANGAMPSCVSKLAPCQGYLNATDATAVPDTCCDPLKEAATTEAACVCAILMNKAALQAFGVKPEQGVLLAKRCGVTTDASTCAKYAAGAGKGKLPKALSSINNHHCRQAGSADRCVRLVPSVACTHVRPKL